MKLLFKLVLVLILLLVIGAVVALFYVDTLAKRGIEKGSTYALGVNSTVDSADVGLLAGKFDMNGFTVANPTGFDGPHFLKLNEGNVELSLPSLRQDVIELPLLRLSGIDVHLQRTSSGGNYDAILESLKKFESAEPSDASKKEGKRFIVREVRIENILVHADLMPEVGSLTEVEVPIDEIVLTDIGSDTDGGVVLGELAGTLTKAVMAAIAQKTGGLLPTEILGDLQGGLSELTALPEMAIGDVGKLVEGVTGDAGKIVEDVTKGAQEQLEKGLGDVGKDVDDALNKGLGGLLGGNKDE